MSVKGYSYRENEKGRVIVGTCELVLRGGNIDSVGPSLIYEYVERHGKIIDIVNQELEKWNEDWDGISGGKDMKEGDFLWDLYAEYIAGCERMVCVIENSRNPDSRIMMDCIHKEGITKIVGLLDRQPDVYFEFIFPGEKESKEGKLFI